MKTVYLLRGLPGSGKTTLAEELASVHRQAEFTCLTCSADDYFTDADGTYTFDRSRLGMAHIQCELKFDRALENGYECVIVHNTGTTEREIEHYVEGAEKYGYKLVSLIVENRHGGESVHNVPEETLARMNVRFTSKLHPGDN